MISNKHEDNETHKMDQVDHLVERARHLSLHLTHPLDTFNTTIDTHLRKIYESLSSSPVAKEEFLRTVQHGSRSDDPPIADPLASWDAFRAHMKDAASCAQAPAGELDVSAPISDYYISSSHNTYLTGNQLYGDAAASAYTSVSTLLLFVLNLHPQLSGYVKISLYFSLRSCLTSLIGPSAGLPLCRD